MNFNTDPSLYDILEIKPDATPQEIREAYLRTKAAFNKDSAALYTLVDVDERDLMLQKIQDAYNILSNTEKRRDYDRQHGRLDPTELMKEEMPTRSIRKIISIDRVPPMDTSLQAEDLLVAPSTDFDENLSSEMVAPLPPPPPASQVQSDPHPFRTGGSGTRNAEALIEQEIAKEISWRGDFIRRVREVRRISIEEISNHTKINRNYIIAIEDENYPKLPAAVFLRGFLSQLAKTLRLPQETLVSNYMARYFESRPDKRVK